MRRGKRPETVAHRKARKHFTETVLEEGGCWVRGLIDHECDYPFDAAHLIDKQFLKAHCKFKLRLDEDEVLACVWDTRNGVRCCRAGHSRLDSPFYPSPPFENLPAEVVQFAIEYRCLDRLETMYPPLEAGAA